MKPQELFHRLILVINKMYTFFNFANSFSYYFAGGAREVLYIKEDSIELNILNRKGFVRSVRISAAEK